jgi:ribosomal protein L37AE/L43A
MKKLKVTVGKNAPVRSFASLPEEQKDLQRFRKIKAMMCPCCGETMLLVDNVWVCQKCSYCIAQSDMLSGEIFWFLRSLWTVSECSARIFNAFWSMEMRGLRICK